MINRREVDNKRYAEELFGRSNFISSIYDEIKTFFVGTPMAFLNTGKGNEQSRRGEKEKEKDPLNILITGERGSGRTHCIRQLLEKLQRDQEFIQMQQITNLNMNYTMQ